jgi:hypothetical protein
VLLKGLEVALGEHAVFVTIARWLRRSNRKRILFGLRILARDHGKEEQTDERNDEPSRGFVKLDCVWRNLIWCIVTADRT